MATVRLRKVGGSTIVAIPPAMLDELHVTTDSMLDLTVQNGAFVIRPARKRYTLEALLAECDLDAPLSDAEQEWMNAPPAGLELLSFETLPENGIKAVKS